MAWRFDLADVAHYQDEAGKLIDWDALISGSPGNGAITKYTQRNNYIDPTAARHRSEMKRVGARRRGLYHWQSPTAQASIASQVAHYKRAVTALEVGEFFMTDSEEAGATEPDTYEELNLIEDWTGRPSAVYCGVYTDGGRIWRSERIRMSRWGPRFMILAAYLSQAALAKILHDLKVDGLPAHMNQFGSSGVLPTGGHVPGVVGRCDMNQVNDFALLDICCGYSSNQLIVEEDEMTTNYVANFDAGTHGPAYPDHDCSLWVLSDLDGSKRLLNDFERAARGWGNPALQAKMSIVPCDDGTLAGLPDWTPSAAGGGGTVDFSELTIHLDGKATKS